MPKFMCIHTMPPNSMTFQQVQELAERVRRDPVVEGHRSAGNLSEGRIVCILESPTKQDLVNFFRKNNMPFDSISEVEFEGEGGVVTQIAAPAMAGQP